MNEITGAYGNIIYSAKVYMKSILMAFLISALLFFSIGCTAVPQVSVVADAPSTMETEDLGSPENSEPKFEGFKVLDVNDISLFTSFEWIELSEDGIFEKTHFIFEGTITSTGEYSARDPITNETDIFTVLDVTVDKVFYQAEPTIEPPSTTRLLYPVTSTNVDYSPECPKAGDRVVFFATITVDNGGIPKSEFAPFCIRDFDRTDIRIENDLYMVDDVFLSLNDKMSDTISTDLHSDPTPVEKSVFEAKLYDAILKYKG